MSAAHLFQTALGPSDLEALYVEVRHISEALGVPLSDADATVQSMPEASPAKWHLAHSAWFFEAMVLEPYAANYVAFDERFSFLFNSYYESHGARQPRPRRGMITRPGLDQIYSYRKHVDAAVIQLLQSGPGPEVAQLVELGCHHEPHSSPHFR
jgi:hypothetical protein